MCTKLPLLNIISVWVFLLVLSRATGQELLIDDSCGMYWDNQVIVVYMEGASESEIADVEAELIDEYGDIFMVKQCDCEPILQLYQFDASIIDVESVRQSARSKSGVEEGERHYIIPVEVDQTNECSSGPDNSYENIILTPVNSRVKVGVHDSGIDLGNGIFNSFLISNANQTNCAFDDNYGYNFDILDPDLSDPIPHGNIVNGIIADGNTPDGLELINAAFFNADEYGNLFDALCALHYLIEKSPDIINMSWGYKADSLSIDLQNALLRAVNSSLLINSAGNDGDDLSSVFKWPSRFANNLPMIVVGAYEDCSGTLEIPDYSNTGSLVNIYAPGHIEDPISPSSDRSGTSFSAAFISRLAATIMYRYSDLNINEVRNCILSTINEDFGFYAVDPDAAIACAKSLSILPIQLVRFEAVKQNETVKLEWETAQEWNHERFILQRSSNQMQWQTITEVAGHGSTSTPQRYEFLDEHAPFGLIYYRLIDESVDGTQNISNIISIRNQTVKLVWSLYQETLEVIFPGELPQSYQIYDLQGRLIDAAKISQPGVEMIHIPFHYPQGAYLINFISINKTENIKVLNFP